MNKKTAIIIIISAILIIIGVSVVVYFFFTKNSDTNAPLDQNTVAVFPSNNGTPSTPDVQPKPTNLPTDKNTSINSPGTAAPQLWQISTTPVGGGIVFDRNVASINSSKNTPTATETLVRYIDRATGNLFEATPSTSHIERLSNRTIPIVYEALWTKTGNGAIIRRIKDTEEIIETFASLFSKATSTGIVFSATFLPDNISSVSVSPDGERIFYIYPNSNETLGVIAAADGSKKSFIFHSSFNNWLSEWPTQSSLVLTTKPSANIKGSAYFLDINTGIQTSIINGIEGLTVKSNPAGTKLLYSKSFEKGMILSILDPKDGSSKAMPINTLPEKCVWSTLDSNVFYCAVPNAIPSGLYPDDWYQGKISFSDSIWQINLKTFETKVLATLNQPNSTGIDVMNPTLNKSETNLLFINKKDLTLWSLRLIK